MEDNEIPFGFQVIYQKGKEKEIISFAVSEQPDEETYYGYRLQAIDQLKEYADRCIVLIAAFPASQDNMRHKLTDCGFKNIVSMDYKIYKKMADMYIANFLSAQSLKGVYDILYIASDNNRTSGAFLCLVDLVKEIKGKNFRILIVLPEYGNGEEILKKENIEYTYIPSCTWLVPRTCKELTWQEKNKADNIKAVECIKELVYKHNIKLIHSNTTYTNIGAIAAMDMGVPLVWHLRENIFEQGYIYEDKKEFYHLINSSMKVIVVSNYLKKCYPLLDKSKVETIYDGVDVIRYYNEREILNKKMLHIVLVGAIYPLKRQEDLVAAAAILKVRGIDYTIDIIGNGEKAYIDKLNKMIAKNNLQNRIHLTGRKDNITDYLFKSDISVVCSQSESFGRVCIESQLAGCLVIGAKAGATAEIIEDKKTGLLYECGNADSLAEKIIYVSAHTDEARQWAKYGQKEAGKIFTKENASNLVYKVYQELLNGGKKDV